MMHTKWRAASALTAMGLALSGCWLQPRLDAGRTNHAAGEQTLTAATVGGLTELWSTSVSSPTHTATRVLAPVAVNDDIYVAASATDVPGVAASLDAATGDIRWTTPLEIPVTEPVVDLDDPAYHAGSFQVPYAVARFGGRFLLDPATGAASDTGGSPTGDLAVADDRLVTKTATVAFSGQLFVATQVNWTAFRPTVVSQGSSVQAVAGDYAFVGDSIAWSDGVTGATGYSPQCPVPTPTTPRTTACMPDWTVDLGADPGNPTALGDDAVVYADTSGTVSVLDMATGAVLWQAELGAVSLTQATVTPNMILVGTSDGRLVALPAAGCGSATCAPLWDGAVGGPAQALVAAGDVAYVSTTAGTGDVAAFDLAGCGAATCDPLVTVSAGHPLDRSMIVHDGRLIAGTLDGHVVAFGLG